jgi:hypothetical protein
MHRPHLMGLAGFVFGLSVLLAAPAALAQAIEAPQADPQVADPQAPDPQSADAPIGTAIRDADAVQPADAAPSEPPAADAPIGTAAQDADAVEPADAAPSDPPGVDAAASEPLVVEAPSGTAAKLAGWVTATGDNGGQPFVIIDKEAANVFVFDGEGSLQGGAPVLVGLARGDDSVAGVGDRELSAIAPDDRTTPAGRFVASFGGAAGNRKVLWVDYADAISLHPVITTNPKERRLQRIKSRTPEDHRITFGCINVPAAFYAHVVLKAFKGGAGIVYILPDTKPLETVFPAFAVATRQSGAMTGAPEGF